MITYQSLHRCPQYLAKGEALFLGSLRQFVLEMIGYTAYGMNRQILTLILCQVTLEEGTEIINHQLTQSQDADG